MEALLAAWLIQNAGARSGLFDGLRKVDALPGTSFVTPAINTLSIPAYFWMRGVLYWKNLGKALANWNLFHGTAMIVLVLLLTVPLRRDWRCAGPYIMERCGRSQKNPKKRRPIGPYLF
ncbi:hypothetical protein ACXR0O_29415 [Verrucomicrobiota bacterium sgz303538]